MGTLSKWKECIWKGNWQPSELEYCQAIYIYNLSIQNRPDRYTFQVATSVMQCLHAAAQWHRTLLDRWSLLTTCIAALFQVSANTPQTSRCQVPLGQICHWLLFGSALSTATWAPLLCPQSCSYVTILQVLFSGRNANSFFIVERWVESLKSQYFKFFFLPYPFSWC